MSTTLDSKIWLFDSVTLSNFALVDRIDLLAERYGGQGAVTTQILDEIAMGVTVGHDRLTAVLTLVDEGPFQLVSLRKDERAAYRSLLRHLGHGESSIIAVAQRRGGTVVSDDRAARATCRELRIPVTGTIGILMACVRDSVLDAGAADVVLAAMVKEGFHSPVSSISAML